MAGESLTESQAPVPFARFEFTPDERTKKDLRLAEGLGDIVNDVLSGHFEEQIRGALRRLRESARAQAPSLRALISPHFGNSRLYRMAAIVDAAPELDPASVQQIAALPLGGRVRVDPWTARAELMPASRVALVSAREKMPFQVTPLMPYLSRLDDKPEPSPPAAK